MPHRPDLFMLGECDQVKTQLEVQELIADSPELVDSWENMVMIQCVGSRTEDNPNCSRICCQTAVKNALNIVEQNPQARVFVLYRDMRTYGFQEEYYQKAREKGVIFVRYHQENPPRVNAAGGKVEVSFTDIILGKEITVSADCLCLSTGLIADQDSTRGTGNGIQAASHHDGYFLEDHVKLRPVDLSVPGFFVAGTAHAPKTIGESLVQARAVASRAQTMLAKDYISLGAATARVDSSSLCILPDLCSGMSV